MFGRKRRELEEQIEVLRALSRRDSKRIRETEERVRGLLLERDERSSMVAERDAQHRADSDTLAAVQRALSGEQENPDIEFMKTLAARMGTSIATPEVLLKHAERLPELRKRLREIHAVARRYQDDDGGGAWCLKRELIEDLEQIQELAK